MTTRSTTTPPRTSPTALPRWLACALLAGAACIASVSPVRAGELSARLDPAATEVAFAVGATGHDVHGAFALRSGEVRFDPESGAVTGEIAVDAASAGTGSKSRDRTMHHEVLESESYPLFVFRPERFSGELGREGTSEVELHGELEVHGGVHPVAMPATVEIAGDRLSVHTRFEVPYVEWGMKNPGFLFLKVAPVVMVTVDAEGTLAAAPAVTAAAGRSGGR